LGRRDLEGGEEEDQKNKRVELQTASGGRHTDGSIESSEEGWQLQHEQIPRSRGREMIWCGSPTVRVGEKEKKRFYRI